MNIDKGLEKMIELSNQKDIQIPKKTRIVSENTNYECLLSDAKLGVSIYMAFPHGFASGTILDYFLREKIESKEPLIVKKHSLRTPHEIDSFIREGYSKLDSIIQNSNKSLRPKDILVISYQSWNDSQVDYSYFIQVEGEKKNPTIFISIDNGNPNGWEKNFKPKQRLYIENGQIATYDDCLKLDDYHIDRIIYNANIIFRKTPLSNVIIEGKIMNNNYQQPGHCIIDIYEGYTNSIPLEKRKISHDEHIKEALKNSRTFKDLHKIISS